MPTRLGQQQMVKDLKQASEAAQKADLPAILFATGSNWLALEDGKKASEIFEKCLKDFPKSQNRPDYLLGLGQAYLLNDDKKKARQSFDTLLSQYPQSEASLKARELMNSF
jgi:TolA-binding protein